MSYSYTRILYKSATLPFLMEPNSKSVPIPIQSHLFKLPYALSLKTISLSHFVLNEYQRSHCSPELWVISRTTSLIKIAKCAIYPSEC
jgi:hypothetical protein